MTLPDTPEAMRAHIEREGVETADTGSIKHVIGPLQRTAAMGSRAQFRG